MRGLERNSGTRFKTRRFVALCDLCSKQKPGWLWMGGNDYVRCPQCEDGLIKGRETQVDQTRRIFLPRGVVLNPKIIPQYRED